MRNDLPPIQKYEENIELCFARRSVRLHQLRFICGEIAQRTEDVPQFRWARIFFRWGNPLDKVQVAAEGMMT